MRLSLLSFLLLIVSIATPAFAQSVCAPAVLSSLDIKEETAGYSIDMKYPVLCSPTPRHVIRDYVTSALGEFKADFPEHDLSDYPHKHEMLTEYAVWQAEAGRYTSVKLQVMVYTGGAHPNHWPVTWVFDMTTGAVLTLDDLFEDVDMALAAVSSMVRATLTQLLGEMVVPSMLEPGIAPSSDNYASFILNEEGIAFFFPPYQVAPYAAGQQVVTIPWERVEGLLNPAIKRSLTQ